MHDPRLIDQYCRGLHDKLNYYKVVEKLEDLQQAVASNSWTAAHTAQYQHLDAIITESMIYAERQTGKTLSKRFEWSPTLKQAVQAFHYWRLRLLQKRGRLISTSRLENYRNDVLIPSENTADMTETQIMEAVKQTSTTLRNHQRHHIKLRSTYLEELADAIIISHAPI